MWLGETPKNIVAAFRAASEQNAVLFFDEADAIATRRSIGAGSAPDRERNLTVNVLLRELETFNGIVIFATNLAANFDRGFERRIRTHVLFEIPGAEERARIWHLQIHPTKTPLGPDVDFNQLAERYVATGGDIKNAVIKAAAAAAAELGPDLGKEIGQGHFESAIQEVLAAKTVMRQSLFDEENSSTPDPLNLLTQRDSRWRIAIMLAIGLSSTAFIAAIAAIALAFLR
jgi:SpoVK/Ycf46/Vps4 family AAA+-type ATPase